MTKTDTQVAIASYCGAKITSNESPNATWCSIGFPQLHLKLISKDKKSFFSFYSSKKTKKGEPVLGAWLKDNLESKFHSTEFSVKDTPVKDEEGYVAEFDLGVRWDGWENLADAEKDKVKALYDRLAQFITSTWPTGGKQEENNTFMQWNESHPEKWHDYMRLRHLNVQDDQSEKDSKISDARNLIYFGAPGTGKSHQLKIAVEGKTDKDGKVFKDIEQNIGVFVDVDNNKIVKSRYERVTFYPTYSYAQFVGCYKPVMKPADGGKEEIAYEFVPGPFLRVLVDALKEPTHNHCLVIEEINRANAAAVFGDVFQLLDRGSDGVSEYDVAASEDIKRFLQEVFKDYSPSKEDDPEESKKRNPLNFLKVAFKKDAKGNDTKEWDSCRLRIPSNMYIWATMNSADQGVFPMDTAFKRRWEFEYIPIDAGEDAAPAGKKKPTEWTIDGVTDAKGNAYNWNEVRKFVNSLLSLHGVNEDKLMGAHFVQAPDGVVSAKAFESKVLMYLWEDAGRMCRKDLFDDIATYSNLLKDWHGTDKVKAKGIKVFDRDKKREDLESELKDWYKNVTEAPSAD